MDKNIYILGLFVVGINACHPSNVLLHPDTGLNVIEMIIKHGYPLERHVNVETKDGYLLELHRIPHGIDDNNKKPGFPVLLQHGLASSSTDWINAGPGRSLAYALADMGLDVWLGNNRNNMWGRKHIYLDPDFDKKEYWDFSFHELGMYDLPAIIDYILDVNGAEQLFYIGHSQGTTQLFALLSEKPEYNSKIKLMTALAPAVYMSNLKNPFIQFLSMQVENVEFLSNFIGMYEFLPNTHLGKIIGNLICDVETPLQLLCENVYFLICGYDSQQINSTLLPVIEANLPAGSSSKEFLHFGQAVKTGQFQQYNYYSTQENMERYGQPEPPQYDLNKVTAPIALHYGQNDWLAAVVDVELLNNTLPNVILSNKIAYKHFNHGDFLWANDVFELLYNDVITTIKFYMK